MTKIRLAVVGRREVTREGITKLPVVRQAFNIVSSVATKEELVKECRNHQPDVILICFTLPECGAIESIQYIHEKLPESHIILIDDCGSADELMDGMTAGIRGYFCPIIRTGDLINAIYLVAGGMLILSPNASKKVFETVEALRSYQGKVISGEITVLTNREKEVLSLVRQGLINKEIAAALNISEHTVKVHVLNVMQKLNAHTRQEAVSIFSGTQ